MPTQSSSITRRAMLLAVSTALLVPAVGSSRTGRAGAEPVSLVRNGGFEQGVGERPFSWLVSVAEAEGASALWDDQVSHSGLRSVKLSTSTEYSSEPFNNWSQNIEEPLADKRVTVRGFVKGHDVQSAALWLQCFRRGYAVAVSSVMSSETAPLLGSFGWTEQEASVYVPQDTGLVVVRLVLVGTGTVWFDDITIEVAGPLADRGADEDQPAEASVAPGVQDSDVQAALEAIAEDNRRLRDVNETLSQQIEQLADRVRSLQSFLEQFQKSQPVPTDTALPFIIPPRNIPSRGSNTHRPR